jgi:hypothetical protein
MAKPTLNGRSTLSGKPSFQTMKQMDVPQSRDGKHRKIIAAIMDDLDVLKNGSAIKVPLTALGDSKENVRSALSRETHKRKLAIATASDAEFLYVWRTEL